MSQVFRGQVSAGSRRRATGAFLQHIPPWLHTARLKGCTRIVSTSVDKVTRAERAMFFKECVKMDESSAKQRSLMEPL